MRKNRSVSIIAAAGVLAFGLAGCGASNDAKKDDSASKETTTASETKEDSTSSESSASSSDESSDSGSGTALSGYGTPVEVDSTPYSDEDKQKGAEIASDFYAKFADGKLKETCPMMVQKSGDKYVRFDTDAALEECAKAEKVYGSEQVSEEDAKVMKETLVPENLEVRPNDDGTAGVFFQGKDMQLRLIKVKGEGPLLDMTNV